jgi:hypothetical protein
LAYLELFLTLHVQMTIIKQIIGLTLVLTFLLPQIYQNLHIAYYHSDSESSHHHACTLKHDLVPKQGSDEIKPDKSVELCLICAHLFSPFYTEPTSDNISENLSSGLPIHERLLQQYFIFPKAYYSLRAPPNYS